MRYRSFSVAILSSLASSCHRYGTASYAIVVLCSGRINRAWPANKGYVRQKTQLAVAILRESSSQCRNDRRGTQPDITHWCFDTRRQREALNSALGNSSTTSVLMFFQLRLIFMAIIFNFSLTLRRLKSYIYIYIYIYGAPILDVPRSHTTTHHSR